VFAYLFARMAKIALAKKGSGDPFYTAKLHTARFYFAKLLPETAGLIRTARAGVAPLMAMDEAFSSSPQSCPIPTPNHPGDNHEEADCHCPAGPLTWAGAAFAQATPVGLWKTIDDETKAEKSLVRISRQRRRLSGKIEKLLDPPSRTASATSAKARARTSPSAA
jgi:hypothetical protein